MTLHNNRYPTHNFKIKFINFRLINKNIIVLIKHPIILVSKYIPIQRYFLNSLSTNGEL